MTLCYFYKRIDESEQMSFIGLWDPMEALLIAKLLIVVHTCLTQWPTKV